MEYQSLNYQPITKELWQRLPHEGKSIMVARWPGW